MAWIAVNACAALMLAMFALPACSEQPIARDKVLSHQLDMLESSVSQRRDRTPRTRDLLTDQDLRISEQRLNTLKTRAPRNAKTPLRERQLDRVQRQNRLFDR